MRKGLQRTSWRAALAVLALWALACGEPPAALFILAGQSNMGGVGAPGDLPPELAESPARFRLMTDKAPEWGPLALQQASELRAGLRFGPEIAFAHEVAKRHPGRDIAIVKWSYGGSPIAVWNPNLRTREEMRRIPHVKERWVEKGPPFAQLVETVARAREAEPMELLGLAWMQGEGDSKYLQDANAYEARLRILFESFRSELAERDLPITFGLVNPVGGEYRPRAVEIVRAAQRRVAADDALAVLVDTDDLSKDPDRVHYDGPGSIELGRRFAAGQAQLEDDSRGVLRWLDALFRLLGRPAPF